MFFILQILIFDKMPMEHYVDEKTPGTSFPDTRDRFYKTPFPIDFHP
jgi:hypothetical protein